MSERLRAELGVLWLVPIRFFDFSVVRSDLQSESTIYSYGFVAL